MARHNLRLYNKDYIMNSTHILMVAEESGILLCNPRPDVWTEKIHNPLEIFYCDFV